MKIEVFGSGCAKCRKAEEIIRRVLAKVGVEAEVVHVTDLNEIVSRGILVTPAVVVDGVKKVEGKVPSEGEIRRWVGK
ncbi:MAG: thioredoxin family protein [Bacillota bacterium]